jgi:tetratricopeptide (TPR) repeat protein
MRNEEVAGCQEALPVLEGIESPQEFKEGIAFYLGHCYFSARDLDRAEEKIKGALMLGLPKSLEYRAHCDLGVTYYYLKEYGKAKEELESVTRMPDFNCFRTPELWKWLEATCRALGLRAEAENYARLARPS